MLLLMALPQQMAIVLCVPVSWYETADGLVLWTWSNLPLPVLEGEQAPAGPLVGSGSKIRNDMMSCAPGVQRVRLLFSLFQGS